MWVIKFKVFHEDCAFSPLCGGFNITDFIYLLGFNSTKNKFQWTNAHILEGDDENVNKFIENLKRSKVIKKLNVFKNYVITLEEKNLSKYKVFSPLFSKEIFYIKPIMIKSDGHEYWSLAAWNKKTLIKAFDASKHFGNSELLQINKVKLEKIFLPHITPELTEKQIGAIKLAIKRGYYRFPKETNLEKLARETKISKETFFEHLAKAESKIIPFLTENI
ncbi:MAG: helix-turn-helix domain-containing protein [Nanoarchaeota archaeon]|nr:helix-turn-helix domain-containing protein [Nanoarchaeota archaeon]